MLCNIHNITFVLLSKEANRKKYPTKKKWIKIKIHPKIEEGKMIEKKSIDEKNKESLQAINSLLAGLTEKELSTPMPAGWTVSAVLVHMAFWDQRALTLLEKWEKDGIVFSPVDIDVTNDVSLPLCLAIPSKKAVELFLKTAEAINKHILELSPEGMMEIEEKGKNVNLLRANHRIMHLNDIKTILKKV
jgi:hypothetical protein